MVPISDIVGYIIAIVVAKLIVYFLMKLRMEKKRSEIADIINEIADMLDNFKPIRNILKEVAWYIKNDKISDKTSLLEDVKKHLQ